MHMTVIWVFLRLQVTEDDTPKVQTHAQHRNSESVKQSTRYVTHGHTDVLCKTMDNTLVHGETHGI